MPFVVGRNMSVSDRMRDLRVTRGQRIEGKRGKDEGFNKRFKWHASSTCISKGHDQKNHNNLFGLGRRGFLGCDTFKADLS